MKNIVRLIALLTFFTTLQEFSFATITLSEIQTNVTCYGGNNGSINVTPSGGSLPYFYTWNDGNANQNRTNLMAGIYDVTITDNTGATAALTVIITESPGLIVSVVATPEHCSGQSTGTITVSINGVTPGYTYLWNDGIMTQNRVNLTAAVYYVTITDSMQCSAIDSGNVTQPIPIVIQLNAIPLTCFGSNNGAINTNVSGGASPFSYNWSGGMYSRNIANLVSSNYVVTVTDLAGCSATASAFVPEPLQLTATAISSPLSCSGGPTGSVNTTVNGGTPGYTYWWGSGVMSQDRININSGNYSVTVTDGNGCTVNATANILAYTPLALSTTQVNNVCFGGRMGSIDPTVLNGSSPYSFMWSTGTGTQNASALASGTFTVTVMDGHACTASINANITEPPFSTIVNSNIADPQCAGESNGSISINISNANPPFTYIWGGGATTQTITNLVAGIYMVTVTDNSGCIVTSSFNPGANWCCSIIARVAVKKGPGKY